jgi:pimeloyl-ACP methyl ester carboxylesterase
MLHSAGYGVLAYDARGHGRSAGHENALGWYGDRDLAGAVAYLRRTGADPERIAALGLSMGGEEALRAAAAAGAGLAAVVADGAGAGTLGDTKLEQDGDALLTAVTWIGMRTVELFSGDSEPTPLADIVRRIDVPVLLIASNRRFERHIDSVFAERIGPQATLWYLADAGHTRAFARHPERYRDRVLGFLANALR